MSEHRKRAANWDRLDGSTGGCPEEPGNRAPGEVHRRAAGSSCPDHRERNSVSAVEQLRATNCPACSSFRQVLLSERASPLQVAVERAQPGRKCERCWKYTEDVGSSAELADRLRRLRGGYARDREWGARAVASSRLALSLGVFALDRWTKRIVETRFSPFDTKRRDPRLLQHRALAESGRGVRLFSDSTSHSAHRSVDRFSRDRRRDPGGACSGASTGWTGRTGAGARTDLRRRAGQCLRPHHDAEW